MPNPPDHCEAFFLRNRSKESVPFFLFPVCLFYNASWMTFFDVPVLISPACVLKELPRRPITGFSNAFVHFHHTIQYYCAQASCPYSAKKESPVKGFC